MKIKRLVFLLLGCALVATLLLARQALRPPSPDTPALTVVRPAEAAQVHTLTVQGQALQETLAATGTIRADESVEIRAEIPGKLMRIHFQEGAAVRAGDLLVTINDAELQASLQRAGYRRALAELKIRRLSTLRDQGGVTQQEYDIAASELNVLTAEVALIEAQLAQTVIRAPFAGLVGLRSVSEGAYVTPATRIATLQRLDRLKVDFNIPEKYAGRLGLADEVTISMAGGGPPLMGRIHAVEPLVDASTRTVLVRAVCLNPPERFFAGGFVSVKLSLARIPDAILIPALALVPGANEQSVFVVEGGQARRRVVRTGTRTDSAVQIIEGLKPGDLVIVSGLQQVRAGLAVHAVGDGPLPPAGSALLGDAQTAAAALN